MTQTLETLARQSQSMQGIRSVVHTMKTLSVINAAPYEQAAKAIQSYHDTVLKGLHAFITHYGPLDLPAQPKAHHVVIAFGSDHGLCGNYNESLAAHLAEQLGETEASRTVLCVGSQMADALADQHIEVTQTFFSAASVDGIRRLANLLSRQLETLRTEQAEHGLAVTLAYVTEDAETGRRPEITPLLPIDPALIAALQEKPWCSRSRPFFSMQAQDLFEALIRNYVFSILFQAIAEALKTENAARLARMQQAERAVDDRLEILTAQTRAVRQDQITTELIDVIIGFEALKK